ncbi:MAG: YggS family pyridoxal phosphate-dependent enzyme [Nitrospirae bacterium]|nr:YggS family pyridoxal phosphate-dependent enzyme [Nitrospirota bacterium]
MISDNLHNVIERMAHAAGRAGRNPEDVVLIAASKGVGIDRLREGLSAGIRVLGESKVQEAMPKIQAIGKGAEWHFIGHLQGNKVKYVVGEFTLIHSADSIELSEAINSRAEKTGVIQKILIEVNVSGEKGKFGIMPEKVSAVTKAISAFHNVSLRGFMTIPPYSDNPEDARPYFRMLREIRDNVRNSGTCYGDCRELSMGMSGDFEVAIEEGATMVRIGTAIFGARKGR